MDPRIRSWEGVPGDYRSRERQSLGNRERIADERVSASVVEPPQEHRDRLTRHPNANEANRRLRLLATQFESTG
jgi:hypothetical protein